jgi:sugar phosphate isomerase/epimerase
MDVAIRDAMVPGDAGAFFDTVRAIGASAVEIEVDANLRTPRVVDPGGRPYSIASADERASLKRRLADEGLRPSALLVANDFSSGDAAQTQWVFRTVFAAAEVGARAVRIDPLHRDKGLAREAVRRRFVDAVRHVLRETAGSGVHLAMENHGPLANDPLFIDTVFAGVDHPRLGLTLDTGNFYWFGFPLEEVYRLIEKYAPRTDHTHLKNINYPPDVANRRREIGYEYKQYCCGVDEGNLDLRRVIAILKRAGYGGDLCVEDESLFKQPPEERVGVIRREVEAVRAAMAEA